jgi:peptidoglycan/LPS O-acetylase OafA/YrhL
MLIFENLNALFYWQPAKENYFNTTNISWFLLVAMVVYIAVRRQHESIDNDGEDTWWPVAARWGIGLVCIFLFTLAVASKTNGELTMQSAEMRWPEWSHSDGSPPPR